MGSNHAAIAPWTSFAHRGYPAAAHGRCTRRKVLERHIERIIPCTPTAAEAAMTDSQPAHPEPGKESGNEPGKLKCLGPASAMVDILFEMIGKSKFFEDFTLDDIRNLSRFMTVYRAESGATIIREGDMDDYMLFILEGRINIVKTDANGERHAMSSVGPGTTLGEMSMIDGEPRFATCIAVDATTFSVFARNSMVRIIMEEPHLGAKVLIKLVTLLSQRLRDTSSSLLHYLQRTETV
ncbi:MAG: Crp/Fnr family transcriptional regulator [Gammaproteobacteria bacterium]